MAPLSVHIDTDIGGDIDDLCALALLLRWPGVEITGITTVAEENGTLAGFARQALRLAGRSHIPVAAGADLSQVPYRWRPRYPLDYWPEPILPLPGPIDRALDLLKASVEAGAAVVALGPYTNLALLERRYPGLLRRTRVFLSGGFVFPVPAGFPQLRNEDDYNLQMDVDAAQQVLGQVDCTMVPLAVTLQTALRRSYLPGLAAAGPLGLLVARQAEAYARDEGKEEKYGRNYPGLPPDIINSQHDPLACAVAMGWQGAKIEELPLRLEVREGWLHEKVDESGKVQKVVTAIDATGFNELWYNLVAGKGRTLQGID